MALSVAWSASPARTAEFSPQVKQDFRFPQAGVVFSHGFAGARLNSCIAQGPDEYDILVRPENTPINDSAWYAFQVTSAKPRKITVRIHYQHGSHRYRPKISRDGAQWTRLDARAFAHDRRRNQARLSLAVGPQPLWVSAQELITLDEVSAWMGKLEKLSYVTKSVIGQSVEKRPLHKLVITETERPDHVFLIARQHPPEVTGALGMMHFVETIVGDAPLARKFRRRFSATVIPLVNPDGVAHGHWRHNMRGVDLNRDWGPFEQPETRAVRDQLLACASRKVGRLRLFLDFHSTYLDALYAQPDSATTLPAAFTNNWMAALGRRHPDYAIHRAAPLVSGPFTSRSWVYRKLGIPSITYEFGDETSRAQVGKWSRGAAEEMMKLLLARTAAANP